MARRRRDALVAFFEVQCEDGTPLAEAMDWQEMLAYVANQDLATRQHPIHDANHWGQAYQYQGAYHLILARRRDEVSSLDVLTGEIVDSESDATKPWVEVSVAHFLPNLNRLGYVLGSNASPRISSLAHWINAHNVLDERISIVPVLDRTVLEKIRRAESASFVSVAFDPGQLDDAQISQGLMDYAQKIRSRFGYVSIDLELKVEKMRGGPDEQRRLLQEAQHLSQTGVFTKAAAGLVWHDREGNLHRENVDFLKHRLARTMKITLVDKNGKSIRIESAIDAIYRAADALKEDLYEIPDTGMS